MDEPQKAGPSFVDALWEKITSRLGASSETVQKIKFGRGAVGKIAIIAVAAFAAISAMALRLGLNAVYVGIAGVVIIALGGFGLIFYIVCKRPELAVMEGAELALYQHVTMSAKGYIPNPSDTVQNTPQLAPGTETTLLPVTGEKKDL